MLTAPEMLTEDETLEQDIRDKRKIHQLNFWRKHNFVGDWPEMLYYAFWDFSIEEILQQTDDEIKHRMQVCPYKMNNFRKGIVIEAIHTAQNEAHAESVLSSKPGSVVWKKPVTNQKLHVNHFFV